MAEDQAETKPKLEGSADQINLKVKDQVRMRSAEAVPGVRGGCGGTGGTRLPG